MSRITTALACLLTALAVWSCDAIGDIVKSRPETPVVSALNVGALTPTEQQTLQALISDPAIEYAWLVEVLEAQIAGKVITIEEPPPEPDPPPDPPPVNGTEVRLAWDAPTENSDGTPLEDLAGYNVWVVENGVARPQEFVPAPATEHTVSLPAGTHRIWVTAEDAAGNRSAPSNELELSF